MADPLQLFPSRIAIGRTPDGKPILATPEFLRALGKMFERVGGATGPSTTDLNISDDEDSGLEELRAEQWKHNDSVDMAPPVVSLSLDDPMHPIPQAHVSADALLTELNGLRDHIARLETMIEDISRGSLL